MYLYTLYCKSIVFLCQRWILIKTIKLGSHRDRVLSSMHATRKSQARIGLIEKILRLNKMQV
jgi:hypothetical protein